MNDKKLKIAAVGDLHVQETSTGIYHDFFAELSEQANVFVICGDLTDHGLPLEAEILAKELLACRIPVLGVLGNHDLEAGQADEIKKILHSAKMIFLDDNVFEMHNVGFTGVKGFMGGFEKYMLGSLHWESASNNFVKEAIDEALRLEEGLARLKTPKKVVAMHYAPIRQTLKGEPLELYPFLGSSRMVEPIERFDTSVVFHGHADAGTHEGKTTAKGIPVYNVALPLMKRIFPKQPYKIYEL